LPDAGQSCASGLQVGTQTENTGFENATQAFAPLHVAESAAPQNARHVPDRHMRPVAHWSDEPVPLHVNPTIFVPVCVQNCGAVGCNVSIVHFCPAPHPPEGYSEHSWNMSGAGGVSIVRAASTVAPAV
jgi:hypothetical protein